ncbi:hypothetical protein DES49_1420 [Halospina denitrificans]|uniref:Uncharacterized protein n=1 Tax=Halospina denitrificans TaxID=332522 RepID=A0A4R7JZM8_9GAMM|nr:hypothetical protein [Halospina denitrificans]TDT43596.1 hypothetical protein DES49_1420 [Halospina denitrificans]
MSDSVKDLFSEVELFLPSYLTPNEKEELYSGLKDFPENVTYYLQRGRQDEALQGDVWSSLPIINFDTYDVKNCQGVIISNSCDISPENERFLPTFNVIFAPLIRVSKLRRLLESSNISEERVSSTIENIRKQYNTSTFFLPAMGEVIEEDSVALFSDMRYVPMSKFREQGVKNITLHMQGFYLFLMKLSMHFCRFNEGVHRF